MKVIGQMLVIALLVITFIMLLIHALNAYLAG